MPVIDKVLFASFCFKQANFCGVNAHYLAAVAQLRSGISDSIVNGEVGPYMFTPARWEQNRKNPEFTPDFEVDDINSWRMQVSVFARMASGSLDALVSQHNGQMPSALDLYLAQLAAEGRPLPTAAEQEALAGDFDAALAATKPAILRIESSELQDAQTPSTLEDTPQTVLFKRVPTLAPVQGHLIGKMQDALIDRGHLSALDASGKPNNDGVFGPMTEHAIEQWQSATGRPSTGALTHGEWRDLTGEPTPDVYEKSAQLSASFEGTGFGGTNPTDIDNTVVTFGYHGYTITGGNLQKFLQVMDRKHPDLLDRTFTAGRAAQLRTLFPPVTASQAAALARSIFLSGSTVDPGWRAAFKVFGETPEARAGQLDFSRDTYWAAGQRMAAILKLSAPMSQALCFDVALQNGEKTSLAQTTAAAFTNQMSEQDRRLKFGEAIAQAALPQFQQDVRSRKVDTLGEGDGVVHGDRYKLDNWGFAEPESSESNDAPGASFPISENASFASFLASAMPGMTTFSASELLVKGGANASNHLNTDPPRILWPNIIDTVKVVIELKRRLGGPAITLNSVFRSRAYNASVGGALNSMHLKFNAMDIVAHDGKSPAHWSAVLHQMRDEGFFRGGIGLYSSFVHVDTRGYNANWG